MTGSKVRFQGDWRSWLARIVDIDEVTGSNPVSPISVLIDPSHAPIAQEYHVLQVVVRFAAVAQLVERVICNLEVAGSSPAGGFAYSSSK